MRKIAQELNFSRHRRGSDLARRAEIAHRYLFIGAHVLYEVAALNILRSTGLHSDARKKARRARRTRSKFDRADLYVYYLRALRASA